MAASLTARGPGYTRRMQRARTMGVAAQEHHHRRRGRGRRTMMLAELGVNIGPDHRQRRHRRRRARLRRPEPGQGLPVRHLHDPRGPVRRRRRRSTSARRPAPSRPSACASPGCATSTAPSGTSATARSCASATRARTGRGRVLDVSRRLPRGPRPGAPRARRTSPTTCGRTRTSGASSSRSPRSGASQDLGVDGVLVRVALKTAPLEQWARGARDAPADQGAVRPRGHRDPVRRSGWSGTARAPGDRAAAPTAASTAGQPPR